MKLVICASILIFRFGILKIFEDINCLSLATSVAPNCNVEMPYTPNATRISAIVPACEAPLRSATSPVPCHPPPPTFKFVGTRIWCLIILSKMKLRQIWRWLMNSIWFCLSLILLCSRKWLQSSEQFAYDQKVAHQIPFSPRVMCNACTHN
jgi:hypothetical protein